MPVHEATPGGAELRPEAADQLFTIERVASLMQVSVRTVKRLVASGALHSIKVKHSRRIPQSAYRAYINSAPPTAATVEGAEQESR